MRKGIDDDHLTYFDAGRIARDSGVAAVALHGRTASQFYSGQADWSAIARLQRHCRIFPCWATATYGPPKTPSGWSAKRV